MVSAINKNVFWILKQYSNSYYRLKFSIFIIRHRARGEGKVCFEVNFRPIFHFRLRNPPPQDLLMTYDFYLNSVDLLPVYTPIKGVNIL